MLNVHKLQTQRIPATLNKKKFIDNMEGYLLIAPSYSVYLLFVFIPVLATIFFSVTNYDLYKNFNFVGLSNYARMLEDPVFLRSVGNTFKYAVFTIFPPIAIGLVIAAVLNGKVMGQKFCRIAIYIPYLTSMVSISVVWLWIYDPSNGILNQFVKLIGMEPHSWLFEENLTLGCIIIVSIWRVLGYNMIIYLSGLQAIPESLYEAATIDGASPLMQFFKITIPLLKPTTFFLFVIGTIQCFNVFDQVNVMTQGGPANATTTIVHQIYSRAFINFQMGYASSMAVALLCITLTMTMLNFKYGNQGTDVELG